MKNRIGSFVIISLAFAMSSATTAFPADSVPIAVVSQTATGLQEPVFQTLPGSGRKCKISEDVYFTYEFSEKPKMGTVILKVQVFDKNGAKTTPYLIKGRSDMPAMRGAHDSGDVEFKLNRKNDYLMPINIVMPGEWEVRLTFLKDGDPVFFGRINFNV